MYMSCEANKFCLNIAKFSLFTPYKVWDSEKKYLAWQEFLDIFFGLNNAI